MKVSTKFKVDTTICCLVIALLLLIRYVTLWPWLLTFDLAQWSYMTGHVINPFTKFEDPTAVHSWVMSSDISHRTPLTMRLQPLRMRRITWPMYRGAHFFPHIWNPWTRFAYSLYDFYSATIKTNGVICQKSLWPCVKDHSGFGGKAVLTLHFGFVAPKRHNLWIGGIILILQQNRLRWYGHVLRKEDADWVKKCMEYEVEGSRPTGRPKRTWREVVQTDCQARNLNKEDAMDRRKWKKLITVGWWSGWWVGECFFWYRLTRVVPDKGPGAQGRKTVVVVVKGASLHRTASFDVFCVDVRGGVLAVGDC